MYQLKKTLFIAFISITSCKNITNEQKLVNRYALQSYDSIFIVSCASCGGCIEEYKRAHFPKLKKNNGIVIFDSSCKNKFAYELSFYPHISVPQATLDSLFDDFGNMIVLFKKKDNVFEKHIPFD